MSQIVSGTVYGLCGPDGVIRYIGITTRDYEIRFSQHKSKARLGEVSHRANWIRSIGVSNLEINILEYYTDIPVADLKRREIYWIAKARTLGWLMTNATSGGDGSTGSTHTVLSRKKMSLSHTGLMLSEEHRSNISTAMMGEKNPRFGKAVTEDSKLKMSQAKLSTNNPNYGRKFSDQHRERMAQAAHNRWHTNRGIIKPNCILCSIHTP